MLILMDLVVTVQERVCAEENNGAILFHPVEDPCPAQCSSQCIRQHAQHAVAVHSVHCRACSTPTKPKLQRKPLTAPNPNAQARSLYGRSPQRRPVAYHIVAP